MSRIYYDTEFIDDGNTIELISIGMISDKGEEYYAINGELELRRLTGIPWHLENTVPSLPIRTVGDNKIGWVQDHPDSPLIKSRATIRQEVFKFINDNSDISTGSASDNIELWAWYGAYDHVALAQLWGPMVKLPYGIVPMYTNDLRQEMTRKEKLLGNNRLHFDMPKMESGNLHNALDDARLLKKRAEWLEQF